MEPAASDSKPADSLECESRLGEIRKIEVVRLESEGCKAYYTKNGKRQELYHSRKLAGECKKAAKRLVDKLESSDFHCNAAGAPGA